MVQATGWVTGRRGRPGTTYLAAKRATDVVLATLLLVMLLPVIALTALAVKLSSPGPVLFRQVRVGRGRSTFVMLKFRTMNEGVDDVVHREYVAGLLAGEVTDGGGPGLYKLAKDSRVTTVGALLRRSSLDELPQLLNVLRGEMSLVGPRPALPWELDLYRPEHAVRFAVKPGITGLWQVSGRSQLPMLEALELDATYVARRSLWLDLAILLKTIPTVLIGRGAL